MEEIFNRLGVKDKILLTFVAILAVCEETLEEIMDPLDLIAAAKGYDSGYIRSIKKSTFQQTFLRLLREKHLKIERDKKKRFYRLTRNGWDFLLNKFPQLRLKKNHDGFWRIVVYDIKEESKSIRRQVRSGLRKLNFVTVQKSVWVSPFAWGGELGELFEKLKLEDEVIIFKAKLDSGLAAKLENRYWPSSTASSRIKKPKSLTSYIHGKLSPGLIINKTK